MYTLHKYGMNDEPIRKYHYTASYSYSSKIQIDAALELRFLDLFNGEV
jgi:hypothetical protein